MSSIRSEHRSKDTDLYYIKSTFIGSILNYHLIFNDQIIHTVTRQPTFGENISSAYVTQKCSTALLWNNFNRIQPVKYTNYLLCLFTHVLLFHLLILYIILIIFYCDNIMSSVRGQYRMQNHNVDKQHSNVKLKGAWVVILSSGYEPVHDKYPAQEFRASAFPVMRTE